MLRHLIGLSSLLTLLIPVAPTPSLEALFTVPSITGTVDHSLEDKLVELVGKAEQGSTLRLATFVMELDAYKNALVAAKQRGVDVRVVAEGNGHNAILDTLSTELGAGRVTLCQNGCNGAANNDVMHHKFAVFSALDDGRTDVVAQSSQNLSPSYGLHNNMLISSGDPGLATGYRGVFDKLASQQNYVWTAPFTSTSGKITAWMTPRADDPVVTAINDVGCPGSIRVVHSQFATDRGAVIDALKAKKAQGCSVQVVVPEGNQTTATAKLLAQGGIVVHSFRPGGCHYPQGGGCDVDTIHSKIILTDGPSAAAGGAQRKYVYTGSHNLNGGSLTASDDSFVRVDDAAVYAAYDADYVHLMDEAVKLVPAAYPDAALQMAANGPEDQRSPDASAERDGYTAVAWESGGTEVYARIYRYGQPVTGPVLVSMGGVGCATGYDHVQPSAGVDDLGNAYVAWAEDGDCRGEHNIAVRRLSPSGQLSSTIWANDPEWRQDQTRPEIAVTGGGGFTVVWEDAATGTVRAAGYASLTSRSYGPIQVSTGLRPDVAVDGTGVATVVWQQAPDVYGTRLSASGGTVAGRTKVNTNAATQHLAPVVASTSAGAVVVAWSDNVDGVWRVRARGLTGTLSSRFAELPVAYGKFTKNQAADSNLEYPPLCHNGACAVQGTPSIATDSTGRFVVGWTESDLWNSDRSYEVYARGFNADGTTTGRFPCERMNPNTTGNQFATAVSAGSSGFTFFYTEDFDVNNYSDIVARTGFTNTGF
ncbi:phosphatidylserine/phosphatidylglycerophosphate/cardiolipin synthase family protein [Nonomuraea sp. NPDC050556]|uniref:phosphatidylserine/phosphatidylglycerophosphate/ cardiolipin synthase family protein n=1 Tax=Nonomuraea sp. NPDC050556 TaxID=3364369 RepID=UPI0037944BBB